MAVLESFQYSRNNPENTLVNSLDYAAPSGIVAGDLLVIIAANDYAAAEVAELTTAETGWTRAGGGGNGTSDIHVAAFWKIAEGGEDNITIDSVHTQRHQGWFLRLSGANNSDPIDGMASTSIRTTATYDITGLTTSQNKCLIIGFTAFDADPTSFTWNTVEWTKQADDTNPTTQFAAGFATKEQETAGATGNSNVTAAHAANGSASFQLAIAPG